MSGSERHVGVFVDYWWVYSSARQVFGAGTTPPPPWFGNVAPLSLARLLVKSPPAAVRRSERAPGGVHVFVRHYDPEVHRGQQERVARWRADGVSVDVGPPRDGGPGSWQGSVSVALAGAVVEALERRECDTAVVFAGDPALTPLLLRLAAGEERASRVELATWVAADGSVPTVLAGVPGVWVHRLGEASFRHVNDDRRPMRQARARREAASGPPRTAMAAALVAAGVAGVDGTARGHAEAPAARPVVPQTTRVEHNGAAPSGMVRRLTQRLFGRNS